MFTIQNFKKLLDSSGQLVETYQNSRKILDEQRFFASLRSPTNNPERLNDAEFIQNLANFVFENKFKYQALDPSFKGKSYPHEIAPFLKEVISGAMLLELIKITNTYSREETVKTNSALGQIILNLFEIEKLSDVPLDQLKKCLLNLNLFLNRMMEPQTKWHKTMSKDALIEQISCELRKLPVSQDMPIELEETRSLTC